MIAAISGVRAEYIPFPEPDAEAVEVPVVMDPRDWQEFTMTVERKRRVAGSTLDFSFLLDAPAGKYGFHLVRTLVRFTIDGNRVKDLEVIELGKRTFSVT